MALASFPLIVERWKISKLYHLDYVRYRHLRDYLPEELFRVRLVAIEQHISAQYPQVWMDTYLFAIAISMVGVAAAISIMARASNLSVWYPLLILIIPAAIAIFNTRRRNTYRRRLARYYDSLQGLLKELNSQDVNRHIKWSLRRLRETDNAEDMVLKPPLALYNINFIIVVSQIDTVTEFAGENLPAYNTSMMDVVLDIGPRDGQTSNYSSHPLPPAYHASIEMSAVRQPPPAYPAP
ncbi:hypothetical protein BY458DRAFT_514981 [Sporodiniella umbellata]|nr:hypothetical protein BY458DRAFT_514981 [Sporodiniella umbellata]